MQRLYKAAEAAEYLGVGARWLADKAAAGAIPATYVGRYLRFSARQIAEIQQAGEVRPVSERPRRR
ncbi:helix-turn-helix domain-containing protein [Actinomadura flavalba]|uniref:helix-turn-helix domain-containing protein n=1 Tax=Actinomadura flavalba TaxID=1120938 RepID=UPI00037858C3|nr:helix-turn-helix domain-containing protein [Actinomadura flavalba]